MNGMNDVSKERLSNMAAKLDIEMEQKKPHHSSKFNPADYRPTARQKEMHINELIYKEIDMNLDMANSLAFEMLTEFDVDDDKLEELEFLFIEAHTSLLCYRDAFDKLEQAIQS